MAGIVITPERMADHLERLADRPLDLREQIEAHVRSKLEEAEIAARFAAVFFRRIHDKELWRPSGWSSWRAFCGFFSPQEPERIDVLIQALEVLESRGEKRDFGLPEARRLAAAETMASTEPAAEKLSPAEYGAKGGRGRKAGDDVTSFRAERGNSNGYLAARLKRDHPEIAAAVERGQYPSIRAAAIEAGIIKKPDTGRQLDKAWKAATPEQRAAIVEKATLEAGIVRTPSRVERIRCDWREMTEDQRDAFVDEHADDLRRRIERRRP